MGKLLQAFLPQKKNTDIAIDSNLAGKIPYITCYDEEGAIETKPGHFTKTYLVGEIDTEQIPKTSTASARQILQVLMNSFPSNVSYQFTTHNRLIEQETYLKQILIMPDKDDVLNPYIEAYDKVLVDNVGIGHNNIKKTTYFTVSVNTTYVDDAINIFRDIDGMIKERFSQYYGVEVKGLSLVARLRVLYTMFNPGQNEFGKIIDLDGTGEVNLDNMRYMKVTTKDLVAPKKINHSPALKNHIILNPGTDEEIYVRSFAITNVPSIVSDNVISDLTNVSSSMIFSSIYEPIDTDLGYETAKEAVVNNTVTKDVLKRDSIADRKNHTRVQQTQQISHTEKDYFNNAALSLFQKNVASTQKTFAVTFVISIFGASIEDIDRDSALLKISADKFGFKLKSLDLQQLQGFQTALPLCSPRIDLKRIIDLDRLVTMCPVSIQDVIRQGGVYNGLNAINDNLVLLNRKNNKNLCGVIAGVGHSGKTYQIKKEIFNALISTDDNISVITDNDEYDEFAGKLGGQIVTGGDFDILRAVQGYAFQDKDGNEENNLMFKSYFLDAFFLSLKQNNVIASLYEKDTAYPGDDKIQAAVEAEVADLIHYLGESNMDLADHSINHYSSLKNYIDLNKEKYPIISELFLHLNSTFIGHEGQSGSNRLTVYKVKTSTDMLIVMDMLRNKTVSDVIKQEKSNWIFIDPVDVLLNGSASSDYLSEYMYKANMMQSVLTLVLQESIKLINSPTSLMAFEDIIRNSGYFKLLNQGPIERHKYIDLLGIPQALVPYITNTEPGKGIIITSSSNLAFDDSYIDKESEYHKLFAKEIEQIIINENLK